MITLQTPYVQFTELDGSPLDDGAVYIGASGLNPQTNPITVYWDNAGTQPAAQPLSTRSGVIARNGAPARVYIDAASYSLMVRDKMGRLLASELSISSSVDASAIADGTIAEVKLDSALVSKINGFLPKTGGTMTGAITLPGNATNALEAVPKQQAESIAATAVSNRMQYSLTASQPTTSGTAIDFTGIPSYAKRITLNLNGVSLNGSAVPIVQVGAGSVAVSGYDSACSTITGAVGFSTSTALSGFTFNTQAAADSMSGSLILTKLKDHTWVAQMAGKAGSNISFMGGGEVVLGGSLDRLRLTTVAGTATFDAGEASLLIEG